MINSARGGSDNGCRVVVLTFPDSLAEPQLLELGLPHLPLMFRNTIRLNGVPIKP